jgi:hypothetical protein
MKKTDATNKPIRKKPSNALVEGQRITSHYHLVLMSKWVLACAVKMSYREIAEMAGKSKAWWELAGQKQWKRIKPTPTEYMAIKLVYDAMRKFGGDTRGRRELVYRILVDLGNLQRDIAEMMRRA